MANDRHVANRSNWLMQVAADRSLLPITSSVAIFIAETVNRNSGKACIGIETLAAKVDVKDRSVQRAIRGMVKAGHLVVEQGRGRKNTNLYKWILKPRKGDAGVTLSSEKGDGSVTLSEIGKGDRARSEKVTEMTGKGDRAVTRTCYSTYGDTCEVGAGPQAGPLPSPSSQVEPYDRASPFSDQSALPLRVGDRMTDTGLEPDRSSPSPANAEDVWAELWSAWPWSDDKVEARSAFDSALHEASPQNLLEAYNRGEAGSGDDFTDMIGSILESLRRAA